MSEKASILLYDLLSYLRVLLTGCNMSGGGRVFTRICRANLRITLVIMLEKLHQVFVEQTNNPSYLIAFEQFLGSINNHFYLGKLWDVRLKKREIELSQVNEYSEDLA